MVGELGNWCSILTQGTSEFYIVWRMWPDVAASKTPLTTLIGHLS